MRVVMFNIAGASGLRLAISLFESLGIEIVFIMRNVFIFEMMKVAALLTSKDSGEFKRRNIKLWIYQLIIYISQSMIFVLFVGIFLVSNTYADYYKEYQATFNSLLIVQNVIIVIQDTFIYRQFYVSFFVLISSKNETLTQASGTLVSDALVLQSQMRTRRVKIYAMFIFSYWIYMLFVNNFFHTAYLSSTENQGSLNWIEFMYNLHTRLLQSILDTFIISTFIYLSYFMAVHSQSIPAEQRAKLLYSDLQENSKLPKSQSGAKGKGRKNKRRDTEEYDINQSEVIDGNNRIGAKNPFDSIATANLDNFNTDFENEPLVEPSLARKSRGIASVGKFKEDLILVIKAPPQQSQQSY